MMQHTDTAVCSPTWCPDNQNGCLLRHTCSLHAVLRMVLTLEGTLACNRATNSSERVLMEGLLEEGLYKGAATGSPW